MSYSYRSNRARPTTKYHSSSPRQSNRRGPKGEYIDPSRFVKSATVSSTVEYIPANQFADFDIAPLIKTNLAYKGYKTPSPIQDQAIPVALKGQDVIGVAGTGTGKTAAFAVPLLNRLLNEKQSKAIVIAPTRELAQQIENEFRVIAKNSGLFSVLLIGGTNMGGQLRDLRYFPRIVIGTPGRIKDHLQRNTLKLHDFNIVVLDEVDRMLDMGFVHDVTQILESVSQTRQSFFFSATMDSRVRSLINNFSSNPCTIEIQASTASENVHQNVVRYQDRSDKIGKLHDLLISDGVSKVLIFDETQRGVERLNQELVTRGFSAESIHGGKTQGQRQRALAKFKENQVNVLVATDVAARGIDVADISHVVNYSVPKMYNDYIHRIGRAGRAGRIGYALTFIEN
jgi:ATP-dependent RNA helicase RhlE